MSIQSAGRARSQEFPLELRDLVEDLRVIVWQADAQTWEFNWVSHHAEEVLGYPVEQWLSEPGFWQNHLHPEDRKRAVETCLAATSSGQDHAFEYRAIAADGRIVWLRDIVRVVKDHQGHPRELRGVMVDITEQKAAERALCESEERFRQLAENIRDVFWIRDIATKRALYVSPTYENVWGRSCSSLYENPRSFLEAVHPDDRLAVINDLENKMNAPFSIEYRIVCPDGTIKHIHDRGFPILNKDGQVCRLVGIAEDISERREAEAVLRESEERFRKIFEEGPVAMVLIGMDQRVRKANQSFCSLLGHTESALKKLTVAQIVHPDDFPECSDRLRDLFAGKIPNYRVEKRFVTSKGDVVWVDLFGTVVRDHAGQPLYGLAMAVDNTERKNAEQALQELSGQLMRLQEEERRRIARELHDSTGQNLAALKLNLARLGNGRSLDSRAILADSQALTETALNEIRTLSYLLHPPLLEELGLASAVRTYADGLSDRSGILVHFDADPDLGRLAPEVETTFFRIIQESLTNVHRHSGATECWVTIRKAADGVLLEIRDDGSGLPSGTLERVEKGVATFGVGVEGMRARARQLGGQLKIESSPNGCTVRAVLPAHQ